MADISVINNITGSTTTITYVSDDTTGEITFNVKGTIKRNYLFDIKCKYIDLNGNENEISVITDSTGLQANVVISTSDTDITKDFTFTGDFVRSVRIVDNTTNCTNSFAAAYRTTETSFSGVVQPLKGFTFDEDSFNITASYTDSYGSTQKVAFTRVDEQTATATFSMTKVKSSTDITLSGTAQESATPTGVTINNEITGDTTTSSYSLDESTNTLVLTITGTIKTDYLFGVVATYTDTNGTSVSVPLDISENGLNASVTITDCNTTKAITITGEFVKAHRITNEVYYCETNLANAYKSTDDILAVFTPIDGYYFDEKDFNLTAKYTDKYGSSVTKTLERVSENEATITIKSDSGIGSAETIIFTGYAQVKQDEEINLGSIYAYIVDDDILDEFSKKRYFRETSSYYLIDMDLGDYVNRIKRIYANVEKGGETILKCGNYSTDIECNSIKHRIQTYDFGYLKLPLINGDSNDFNSNVSLMLPFIGIVDVDSSLLGHTIGLVLYIDVITGDGVFKLSVDGYPIKMYDCTPSQDVLYHTYDMNTIGGDKWNSTLLYGLDPYIIISYHESVTKNINNTCLQVNVSSVKGFAQFDNVDVSGIDCLQEEKDIIKTYMQSGVIL